MQADLQLKYSIDDIMTSMHVEGGKAEDIMVLPAEDKFFIGGGCEAYSVVLDSLDKGKGKGKGQEDIQQNVSACIVSPMG